MTTASSVAPLAFIDLGAQRARLGDRIPAAIQRVLEHGQFILGPEVSELEDRLGEHCGARHVVSCSSGTDALLMALLALGIGPGDAVLVPTFTFAATAEVVALAGAVPVFLDAEAATANVDPAGLRGGVAAARAAGATPRAVIAVDLYGQPADYDAIEPFCAEHGLALVADAAQSFGGSWQGRGTGAIGDVACTSFFPSKPLGCYGDGGALFTDDDGLADRLRSIRVHGQGEHKYDNVRIGLNGRLDTIQAAVLLEKLAILDEELAARRRIAQRYDALLGEHVALLSIRPEAASAWAQYTVLVEGRDEVAAALHEAGIPTAVYYHRPLHRQPAYAGALLAGEALPVADDLAARVLSLPMHPYLDDATQDRVVGAVVEAVARA